MNVKKMNKSMKDAEKTIYFLAVPIGNVKDISLRGLEILKIADLILCEDTRKSKDLLKRLNVETSASLESLTSFMELEKNWEQFFSRLEAKNIIYMSDAGTPIVNDPGRVMLLEAEQRGIHCVAIPGASAPIVAIQRSGAFGLPYSIQGYVPKKNKSEFFQYLDAVKSFIFFDTKHSVEKTVQFLIKEKLGNRKIIFCRELTKEHEEIFSTTVEESLPWLQALIESDKVGELTLILEGQNQLDLSCSEEKLLALAEAQSTKDKARLLSEITGKPKKDYYTKLLENN